MDVTMGRISKNREKCTNVHRFSSHGDPFRELFCVFVIFEPVRPLLATRGGNGRQPGNSPERTTLT